MSSLTARWHRSIDEISESQWRALVEETAIPFYRWNWLEALDSSGSTVHARGWQTLHLALWRDEVPIAVEPIFVEGQSCGELVFDQAC